MSGWPPADRQPLVATWDTGTGLYRVTGGTPGPAGAASVELVPGLRFTVDFAEPAIVCELLVDAPAGDDAPPGPDPLGELAAGMLGQFTWFRLLDLARDPEAPELRLDEGLRPDAKRGLRLDVLARLALLVELAGDATTPDLAAALAGIEAAALATAHPGQYLHPLARELVEDAGPTLLEGWHRRRLVRDRRVARGTAAALRRALTALPERHPLAPALARLAADAGERPDAGAADAAVAGAAPLLEGDALAPAPPPAPRAPASPSRAAPAWKPCSAPPPRSRCADRRGRGGGREPSAGEISCSWRPRRWTAPAGRTW